MNYTKFVRSALRDALARAVSLLMEVVAKKMEEGEDGEPAAEGGNEGGQGGDVQAAPSTTPAAGAKPRALLGSDETDVGPIGSTLESVVAPPKSVAAPTKARRKRMEKDVFRARVREKRTEKEAAAERQKKPVREQG